MSSFQFAKFKVYYDGKLQQFTQGRLGLSHSLGILKEEIGDFGFVLGKNGLPTWWVKIKYNG